MASVVIILIHGTLEPFAGYLEIFGGALPMSVTPTKKVLAFCVSLFRAFEEPSDCFSFVLRHAVSVKETRSIK